MTDDRTTGTTPPPPALPPPPVVPVIRPTNGMATASLVLGILGVVLFWFVGFVMSILAIVFGGIGISRANAGAPGKGAAIAGLILGIAGLLVPVAVLLPVRRSFG
jgi:hypothetical protein